ncbi:MAG TPA: ATP-binding protein [Burkholderiales bacterium]|nr:ATP-binding protein [Burkholderiales bacterium]
MAKFLARAALLVFIVTVAQAASSEAIRLTSAEFVLNDSATPPREVAWTRVELPERWRKTRPEAAGPGWYRATFEVPQAQAQAWLVYLPRMRDGGRVFLNGELLGEVQESDASLFVRWMQPHAFQVAPARLRTGTNELQVRVPGVDDQSMSTVYIGAETAVRPLVDARHWIVYTSAQVTVIFAILTALFVIAIWVRRRMAFEFGLFGLATLFWGLRTVGFIVEVYSPWGWHAMRVLQYTATGGFVVTMTLFMLRYSGLQAPRFEKAIVAYWPSGPLLLAIGGMRWHDFVDRYYQVGLIGISSVMLATIFYAGWRLRTLGALALCGGILVGVGLGVHDYLLSQGWFDYERPYLLHFGADLLILIVGGLLADRFVRSLREAEQASAHLAERVREKEQELLANYERLRGLEREHAVTEERHRIMQDMHDGLGSQLLTSLAAVERGALDRQGVAQALREAMDEMRLVIDTLSPGREGLLEALGNLRYRLEPRFRSAGVELRMRYRDIPDRLDVPAESALQILRVLQESLANVLKHSNARVVDIEVALEREPARLVLRIADDGGGFELKSAGSGRGIPGMRRRAERIGAALEIAAGNDGTCITLACPLS